MKPIAFLAFIVFAAAVWAQAPAKPEAPKPAPEAAKPAAEAAKSMVEVTKPAPMKDAAAKPMADASKQTAAGPKIPNPRRWNEDARHCLERPTPTEVIKCAEEYL